MIGVYIRGERNAKRLKQNVIINVVSFAVLLMALLCH